MDFVTYLEGLPADVIGTLYSSPWTCRAVLRGISPLAKQYVLRMLLLDGFTAESTAASLLQQLLCCRRFCDQLYSKAT